MLEELRRDHRLIGEVLDRLKDPANVSIGELDTLAALLETHLVYEERKLVAALNRLGEVAEEEREAVARAVTLISGAGDGGS